MPRAITRLLYRCKPRHARLKRNGFNSLCNCHTRLCPRLDIPYPFNWAQKSLAGRNACGGAYAVIFWAFIPDCVEYGQIESGYRSEAGVFGSVLVIQKLSGALMGLLVGFMLSSFGIAENTDFVANSEKITIFLAICPAFFMSLTVIPILLLPLGRDKHTEILNQLKNKGVGRG